MNNSLISIPLHAFIFQTVNHRIEQTWSVPTLGMDRFHFFKKRSLRFENDEEKRETKRSFLKKYRFLKNGRFQNDSFSF